MKEIYGEELIKKLKSEWELWELLWEWKDRIVYVSTVNKNGVMKVPKDEHWAYVNKLESETYMQEEYMRMELWQKYFKNWLARCWLVDGCLYMERLKYVTEASDFWVNNDWIVRRFDIWM